MRSKTHSTLSCLNDLICSHKLASSVLVAAAIALLLAACSSGPSTDMTDPASGAPQLESGQTESGLAIYQAICSQCHGANAEGHPFWLQRNPDGSLNPPPHDSTGHTWHHSDGLLFRTVRDGGTNFPGFKSNMPAFGERLSSEEIKAVIAYFKSLWEPEQRSFQTEGSQRDPFP